MKIDIVFDGPPGPEAGRFVEVEDENRRSISVGEWLQRPGDNVDGNWVLRLDVGEAEEPLAELRRRLGEVLDAGLTENGLKAVKKKAQEFIDEVEGDLEWRMRGDLAINLSGFVSDMSKRAIEALLAGNEEMMRQYLSCQKRDENGQHVWVGWTGRSTGYSHNRKIEDWHSVIHGKLHESGFVELRRKIVEAHRDLLVSERVLDLEDQVKSLVAQVNRAEAEKRVLGERLRDKRIEGNEHA
jgi:hypothetical protein